MVIWDQINWLKTRLSRVMGTKYSELYTYNSWFIWQYKIDPKYLPKSHMCSGVGLDHESSNYICRLIGCCTIILWHFPEVIEMWEVGHRWREWIVEGWPWRLHLSLIPSSLVSHCLCFQATMRWAASFAKLLDYDAIPHLRPRAHRREPTRHWTSETASLNTSFFWYEDWTHDVMFVRQALKSLG